MHTYFFLKKAACILPLLLLTVFAFPLSASKDRKEEMPDLPDEIFRDSAEILKEIRKASPEFYRQLTAESNPSARKSRTKQLLSVLSPAIAFQPETPPGSSQKESGYYPAVMLPGRILYCRISVMEPTTVSSLQSDLSSQPEAKEPLTGIILDLRNCRGGVPSDAQKDFSLFLPPSGKKTPVPILVLTAPTTQGAAEILAQLLEHTQYGLTMGEPTAGKPFPVRRIDAAGHTLFVPVIPEGMEKIRIAAHSPAIRKPARPQLSYPEIVQGKHSIQSDPCLSAAHDLLLSLDTVRTRFRRETGIK